MSVEENKAIARRLIEEGWVNPNILDELITTDVAAPDILGLDAYKQAVADNLVGCPDIRWTVEDIIAEGDKVVIRWKATGTNTGEWDRFPPTNKQVSFGGTTTSRIVDGKIVKQWQHFDRFRLYTQLGFIPTWEEFVKQANAKQE